MAAITAALVKQLREKTGAGMMDCKNALKETDGDVEAANDWLRKKGLAAAAKKAGRATSEGLVGLVIEGKVGALVEINSETDFVARNEMFQALVSAVTALAPSAGGDLDALGAAIVAGSGRNVADEISRAIGTIGENLTLRRTSAISVEQGAVGGYVHGQLAAGLGRIGVIVGVKSTGDAERLSALGKQLAMQIAAALPQAVSIDRLPFELVDRERAIFSDQARASGKPDNIVEKIVDGRMRKFYEDVVLLEQKFVIDPDIKVKDAIKNAADEIGAPIEITEFVRFTLGEGLDVAKTDLADEVAQLVSS